MPDGPPLTLPKRAVPRPGRSGRLFHEILRQHPRKVLLLAVLIAAIVPAAQLWSYLVLRNEVAAAWERADRTFQQGNFPVARDQYQQVRTLAENSKKLPDVYARLAEFMSSLSESCQQLTDTFKRTEISWRTALEDWRAFEHREADVRQLNVSDSALQKKLAFTLDERLATGTRLMVQAAQKLIPKVYRVQFPDSQAVARIDEVLSELRGSGTSVIELEDAAAWAHQRLRLIEGLREFQARCDQSIASLEPLDLQKAKGTWQTLKINFPERSPNSGDDLLRLPGNLWEGYVDQLEQELRQRSRILSEAERHPQKELIIGHVGDLALPQLPTQDFTALAALSRRGSSPAADRLIFTQVDDRCYALNSQTGHPVWVLRTGYDRAALPIQVSLAGNPLLVIPWECETGHAITVADKDLNTKWTWQLPPGAVPTGPPVIVGGSTFVSLTTGQIVQVDLTDGRIRGLVTLPSTLVGPLHATEDGQDAAVVGDNLAIYFFRLRPTLELTDILLPDTADTTVSACATWIPPFALVFKNDLAANCEMTVHFRDREQGFRKVADRKLPGRVWQAPVVNGTRFLVMTDLGTEVIYGLRVDDLQDPLFETFRLDPPGRGAPRQPFCSRHLYAPFLAAMGPEIMCYGLDLLESQPDLRRKKRWSRTATDATTLPLLPLQTTDEGVVVVTRNERDNQVRTECFHLQTGESLWRTDLGAPLVEWSVHRQREGGRSTLLARGETYEGYRFSVEETGWSAHRLAEVRANASIGYTFETFSAVWTEHNPPELRHSTLEGVTLQRIPIRAPSASPVHVIEGTLRTQVLGAQDQEPLPGLWGLFVDTAGQFQCLGLNPDLPRIQAAPLGQNTPRAGWFRPLDLGQGRFLAAHPDGHLAVFELLQEQRILFLKLVAERFLRSGLTELPRQVGEHLWAISPDRNCRVLTCDSLTVTRLVQLPARPQMAQLAGDTLVVALSDGTVAAIPIHDAPNVEHPHRVFTMGRASIDSLVPVPGDQRVIAMDSRGQLFAIDLQLDQILVGPRLRPASLPPLIVGNSLFHGSREGSVTRVSLDMFKSE